MYGIGIQSWDMRVVVRAIKLMVVIDLKDKYLHEMK